MASRGWYAEKIAKLKKETSKARKESMQVSSIDAGKVRHHADPEVRRLETMTDAQKCEMAKIAIMRKRCAELGIILA